MPTTLSRPALQPQVAERVTPSRVDPATSKPLLLEQELEQFGTWVGDPIWVPPKDSSKAMAESMLNQSGPLTSKGQRWESVVKEHRSNFSQVREIDLTKASIRLPQGKFFVTVTEQENFDKITDTIPACVQTRLDEFLAGPGKQRGVKVSYLKPLCVEVGDDLILTSREDLMAAVTQIQDEVFNEYRNLYLGRLPRKILFGTFNAALAVPRSFVQYCIRRRQKKIDAYHAQLEFKRRRTALRAAKTYRKVRKGACTFDEMLALTNPLQQADVINQYGIVQDLSKAKREQMIRLAAQITAGTVPWFVALSLTAAYISTISLALAPPVMVADPAFVAEMPGARGTLLKIGHFDEVGGVTHVEI